VKIKLFKVNTIAEYFHLNCSGPKTILKMLIEIMFMTSQTMCDYQRVALL